MIIQVLESGKAEWAPPPMPATMKEVLEAYEKQSGGDAPALGGSVPRALGRHARVLPATSGPPRPWRGVFSSTSFTIAGRFPPTCGRWDRRCPRSMDRAVTNRSGQYYRHGVNRGLTERFKPNPRPRVLFGKCGLSFPDPQRSAHRRAEGAGQEVWRIRVLRARGEGPGVWHHALAFSPRLSEGCTLLRPVHACGDSSARSRCDSLLRLS